MYNKALSVLKIFVDHGFEAYIVGGFPRDTLLGKKTMDIDICTNAKPKDIIELFDNTSISDIKYGFVSIIYKNVRFDVTTFRKDIKYENNRKPIEVKYIDDLKKDLLRRDFTINTICIDSNGNYLDILDAKGDLDNKIIKTVGNPRYRLKEDSLRILRAIRFASILDFNIDDKTKAYIKKYGYLVKTLSSERKRDEFDKIFTCLNKEKGRELLIELGIDKYLEINNLKDIVLCNDIIGIWSQIDTTCDYPFSKLEKENIKKIRLMLEEGIDKYTIYKYGLYISSVVGSIRKISYKKINNIYKKLPIYSKKDICINGMEIANILHTKPGNYLSDIINDIEKKIINMELENKEDVLIEYIINTYGG